MEQVLKDRLEAIPLAFHVEDFTPTLTPPEGEGILRKT